MKQINLIMILSILLGTLIFVGCTSTEYLSSQNIIEPNQVVSEMDKPDVIILDARTAEEYEKGHVKGAVHLNPLELSTKEPVLGMVLPKERIEKILGRKGISNTSILYVYDNNGGVNASRVWWTLKGYGHENIKVVNKGEKGLVEADIELTLDVPELSKTTYTAKEFDESMVIDLEEMKELTSQESIEEIIIDVRSVAEFEEGFIPHSILYPHTKNLYTDGAFKSSRNIYLTYHDLGIDKEDEIILYCKTSFRAAQTAILLEEAGFTNVKLYDGAWEEWSKEMPVEGQEVKQVIPTVQDGS